MEVRIEMQIDIDTTLVERVRPLGSSLRRRHTVVIRRAESAMSL